MKILSTILLCLLPLMGFGQGVAVRSLNGHATNLTFHGSTFLDNLGDQMGANGSVSFAGGNFQVDLLGNVLAISFSGDGSQISALNASTLSSGSVPSARLAAGSGTASNFFNTATGPLPTGILTAGTTNGAGHLLVVNNGKRYNSFDGSGLTNLSAAAIASGTMVDGRLSSNVAFLNGTNAFTGTNTFSSKVKLTGSNATTPVAAVSLDANNNLTTNAMPISLLAQSSAASGQVIEWNGSAWVATDVQGVTIPNTFTQTNLVANQLYTNTSGSVQMIIGEVALVTAAGVSGRASFDVMVDQTGGTTYARYTVAAVQTTALTLAQNYTNSFATAISNSAAFYLTNSSAGSGDSATLVSGQCQLLTLSDGAAAGVAMLAANNTFTGTNTFTGPVTVSGSYNVFGQTYFTGPINETNGNLIVTNASAANQGVTIRTNGTLTVDNGFTNNAVGATKVVITDSGGKEVAATLSGLTLSGTTLTASSSLTGAMLSFSVHIAGTPTCVPGSLDGTGGTATNLTGANDYGGQVVIVAGSSPPTGGYAFTNTFSTAFSNPPPVQIAIPDMGSQGRLLYANYGNFVVTTTNFTINFTSSSQLNSGTVYHVNWAIPPWQ